MLRSILWPVLAPAFLYACGTGALQPVIILAALSLGSGPALASALVTAAAVAAGISSIPAGYVINYLGERRSMISATLVAAAMTAICVVALITRVGGGLVLFTAAIVLLGALEVVWGLARQAYVADTVQSDSMALAMTSLGGAQRAGQLVGPLIGSALLLWLPLYSVFVMHIVVAIAATIMIAKVKDPGHRRQTRSADQPKPQIRWKAVVLAGLAMMALAMARRGKNVIIPLWGDHLHLSASTISLLVAIGSAVELILLYPGGRLKDSMGRVSTFAACVVLLGVGFAIMPAGGTLVWFCVGIGVASIGNGLGAGINMTFGADLSPPIGRAKFLGYWNAIGQVGAFAGPALISAVTAALSLSAAIAILAAFPLAGAAWMIIFRQQIGLPGRRQRRRSSQ